MLDNPANQTHLNRFLPTVDIKKLRNFCQINNISSLKLFGSILTEKFGDSSDVDILIEFEHGFTPGYFKLVELQMTMAELFFNNKKVDLRTKDELSPYFRQNVLNHAVIIYG
ncbi:MAG: nucleotidyltransferase family protein [Promethearchaeota archaeon]